MLFYLSDVDDLVYELLNQVEQEFQIDDKQAEDQGSGITTIDADLNNVLAEHNYCLLNKFIITIRTISGDSIMSEVIDDANNGLSQSDYVKTSDIKHFETYFDNLDKSVNDLSKKVDNLNRFVEEIDKKYLISRDDVFWADKKAFAGSPEKMSSPHDVCGLKESIPLQVDVNGNDRVEKWLMENQKDWLDEDHSFKNKEILPEETSLDDIDIKQLFNPLNMDINSEQLSGTFCNVDLDEEMPSLNKIPEPQGNNTFEDDKENCVFSPERTQKTLPKQKTKKRKESTIRLGISKKLKTNEASLRWKRSLFRDDFEDCYFDML